MRKAAVLIMALFAICAFLLALNPLYAADPLFAPVAVCNKGKCVMSEKDYDTYRAWHFALIEHDQQLEQQRADLLDAIATLRGRLEAAAFCQAHRD